jgi:hypothetical protein
MMSPSDFVINTEPTPDQGQYLEDRLSEFNAGVTGITDGEWLAIFMRDERGRIVAGICGNTWGGCLEIRQLWARLPADRPHNGQLPSSRVLRQARLPGRGDRGRPSTGPPDSCCASISASPASP